MAVSAPMRLPTAHRWAAQEESVLARAALRSQHCGVGGPWALEIGGDRIEIYERFGAPTWHHDGAGRDRVIACGAAVAGLTVAVRVLGWLPETELLGDFQRPDLVATVSAGTRARPASDDVRRFQALFGHRRHRRTADPGELPVGAVGEIVRAGALPGVRLVPVSEFVTAGRKQGGEPALLVVTDADGRRDQVLAGAAMQHSWLAAVARGFSVRPQIRAFQSREYRQRVVRSAGLDGSPQLLLGLGIA
ncbi:hypothetical protein [Qaidamihabitans albus]|uniref:hypothetical protein n=1 Tax=Qaidamihabitans albus TaxID=2795733 RepID=UPI0018F11962|nr:hypothetical protein [Qaidamihabitans albus]